MDVLCIAYISICMLHMVTSPYLHPQGQLPPFKSWALSYVREGKIIHNVITQQSRDSTLNLGSLDSPVTLAFDWSLMSLVFFKCPRWQHSFQAVFILTLLMLICFFLAVLQYG